MYIQSQPRKKKKTAVIKHFQYKSVKMLGQVNISGEMYACYVLYCPQIAVPDVKDSAKDADVYIFVLPHQFLRRVCEQLQGNVKENAIGISLIKVTTYIISKYLPC